MEKGLSMAYDRKKNGVTVTHDIKSGAFIVTSFSGSHTVHDWTWGERKALVRDAVVNGSFDAESFLSFVSQSLIVPALQADKSREVLSVALTLLSVPPVSHCLSIPEAQAFLAMRFGWKITDMDPQPARDLDELIVSLLPESHKTKDAVDDGWTRIVINDSPESSENLLENGDGDRELRDILKSLAIMSGATRPDASVSEIVASLFGKKTERLEASLPEIKDYAAPDIITLRSDSKHTPLSPTFMSLTGASSKNISESIPEPSMTKERIAAADSNRNDGHYFEPVIKSADDGIVPDVRQSPDTMMHRSTDPGFNHPANASRQNHESVPASSSESADAFSGMGTGTTSARPFRLRRNPAASSGKTNKNDFSSQSINRKSHRNSDKGDIPPITAKTPALTSGNRTPSPEPNRFSDYPGSMNPAFAQSHAINNLSPVSQNPDGVSSHDFGSADPQGFPGRLTLNSGWTAVSSTNKFNSVMRGELICIKDHPGQECVQQGGAPFDLSDLEEKMADVLERATLESGIDLV
jgi:hypothetical protein